MNNTNEEIKVKEITLEVEFKRLKDRVDLMVIKRSWDLETHELHDVLEDLEDLNEQVNSLNKALFYEIDK